MNDDPDAETSKIINKYIHILLLALVNKRDKGKMRNLIMRARNVCKAPHVYVHTI